VLSDLTAAGSVATVTLVEHDQLHIEVELAPEQ